MKIKNLFEPALYQTLPITRPYIIAEVGVNHEGDIDLAKRLIDEAKEGGADAVKFQTYKAETLASVNSPAYWDIKQEPTTSQYKLFKKHDSFWKKEMTLLKQYCADVDIEFMSTPFDFESAKFLDDLMDVYKISSSDITNKPFIESICGYGKPIILSTGASNLSEIFEAVSWIDNYGNPLALLHCVLNYPTLDENANLGMILDLKAKFPDRVVGYSDHTFPGDMKVCEIATILGCQVIEKHFTHDKTLEGNDHYHAMDMHDLKIFKKNIERTFDILGGFKVDNIESENSAKLNARRSLVAFAEIKKGSKIERSDLTFKRPGHGVSPKFIDQVIGKVATTNIDADAVLEWDMFK